MKKINLHQKVVDLIMDIYCPRYLEIGKLSEVGKDPGYGTGHPPPQPDGYPYPPAYPYPQPGGGYQGYFGQGYPPPPPPPNHHDHGCGGCFSFLQGCFATLCCCCILEECCF